MHFQYSKRCICQRIAHIVTPRMSDKYSAWGRMCYISMWKT